LEETSFYDLDPTKDHIKDSDNILDFDELSSNNLDRIETGRRTNVSLRNSNR